MLKDKENQSKSEKEESLVQKGEIRGLTPKALIIGFICLIGIIALNQYAEFTNSISGLGVSIMPTIAGMTVMFVFMLLSPVLGPFRLNRYELILIYVILMLGGLVASLGLVGFSVGNMASVVILYLDNPGVYGPIYEQLSSFLVIKDQAAGMQFWLGGNDGVPWSLWIGPIITWTIFWGTMFWVLICIVTLIRKHWTDREMLTYPLVAPVVELLEGFERGEGKKPIWANLMFRYGLIFPVIFYLPQTFQFFFPVVPAIPEVLDLGQYFTAEPWSAVRTWPPFRFWLDPLVIGIGYLVSAELTFSLWFFYLLYKIPIQVAFSATGNSLAFQMAGEVGRGMFIGISLSCLYLARHDIKAMIRCALGKNKDSSFDDSNEPLPYAVAFWSGILGIIFVVLFSIYMLKINPMAVVAFLTIFFGVTLGFARLRAEAGYPHTQPSMQFASTYILRGLGQERLGTTTSFTLINYYNPMDEGNFGALTGILLECYKFGDRARINRKSMTKVMILTFLVAAIAGYVIVLPIIYNHGLFNLDSHRLYHGRHSHALSSLQYMPVEWVTSYGLGISLALAMMALKVSFVWWPFNPLGAAMAPLSYMGRYWGAFLIAWLIKTILMRYGGPLIVQKARGFFIGLIVGTVAMSVLDTVVKIIIQGFVH